MAVNHRQQFSSRTKPSIRLPGHAFVMRWAIPLMVAIFALNGAAALLNEFFQHGANVARVEIPIYLQTEHNSAATKFEAAGAIQIEKFGKDFQRRGFFRIGAMPLLVLDGLTIEILDVCRADEALVKANENLRARMKSSASVEGRRFTLVFSNGQKATVKAAVMRFLSEEQWTLENGVVETEGHRHVFNTALLKVHGDQTGQLSFRSNGQEVQLNLTELGRKPILSKQ